MGDESPTAKVNYVTLKKKESGSDLTDADGKEYAVTVSSHDEKTEAVMAMAKKALAEISK